MEKEKEGDLRVPIVFTVFFLCVTAGGIFLILYVFAPRISEPWYPSAALFLVGAPWIFWLITFLYTVIKRCCNASSSSMEMEPEIPLTNSV